MAGGSSNPTVGILTQLCETPNSCRDDGSMLTLFPVPQAQIYRYLGFKSNEQSTD